MEKNQQIIIVGGGLSGLLLAYLLSKKKIYPTVLEASPRLGGRIQTIKGVLETPLELGATWFSEMHPRLIALMDELGLGKYPQYSSGISIFQTKSFEPPQKFFVPETDTPSYRIVGGTQMLTDALAARLSPGGLFLNSRVVAISQAERGLLGHGLPGGGLLVETADGKRMPADKVILCIPPQLAAASIRFSPVLPDAVSAVLPTVQTWMAGAIKFDVEYSESFWRKEGYSGMLYSHAGIVVEMYDHTNFEQTKFGFTGFLNGGAAGFAPEVRRELVLKQLVDLFGGKAGSPAAYFDKVWNDGYIGSGSQVVHRPHQNNGHPLLLESYLDGKLFFGNTETAVEFPGYMEGAVAAAHAVVERL